VRFLLGHDPQLGAQNPRAFLVLADGGPILPGPGVQPQQRSLRRLMQHVEHDPTPRIRDRLFPCILRAVGRHKLFEHLAIELAQAFAPEELPLVERRAVGQRKASQEVVGVELGRVDQVGDALRRGSLFAVFRAQRGKPAKDLLPLAQNGNGRRRPDALAVIDVNPTSPTYSQVSGRLDLPNIGDELHHFLALAHPGPAGRLPRDQSGDGLAVCRRAGSACGSTSAT
jgi:hypothetical protein